MAGGGTNHQSALEGLPCAEARHHGAIPRSTRPLPPSTGFRSASLATFSTRTLAWICFCSRRCGRVAPSCLGRRSSQGPAGRPPARGMRSCSCVCVVATPSRQNRVFRAGWLSSIGLVGHLSPQDFCLCLLLVFVLCFPCCTQLFMVITISNKHNQNRSARWQTYFFVLKSGGTVDSRRCSPPRRACPPPHSRLAAGALQCPE